MVHFVFQYLKTRGYDVIRAPYLCGAQLAYMTQHNQLQAVMGQAGLMIYGIKKVIVFMDLSVKHQVEWVDLDHILGVWGINQSQFVECCLLAGTEFSRTFPFLNVPELQQIVNVSPGHFSIEQAVALVRQMPLNEWVGCIPLEDMRNDHIEEYCVTKALVLYAPVINIKDASIEPLTTPVPADIQKIIGAKLPTGLYALIAAGLVNYRNPQVLSLGELNDKQQSLVDSEEYRALLIDLADYRKKALSFLSEASGYGLKKITTRTYFDKPGSKPKTSSLPSTTRLGWSFTKQELMQEMKAQGVDHVDIKFCLKWHAKDTEHNGPLLKNLKAGVQPRRPDDLNSLSAQTILTFLEALDYFAPDGGMTVLGDVLKETPIPVQEQVLMALELLKLGVLNGEPLEATEDKPFPVKLGYPTSEDKNHILLSRVFSLMPMKLKGDLWHGKVDFDLAGFHCLVRVVNRAVRSLMESSLAVHLLKDMKLAKLLPPHVFSPACPLPSEYIQVNPVKIMDGAGPVSALPSFMLPRTCMGVVCKYLLDYNGDAKSFESTLKKTFTCCVDPMKDLKTGVKFWKELLRCVGVMSEQLGADEINAAMIHANKVLEEKLKFVGW